jgi:PII-like signaling protein
MNQGQPLAHRLLVDSLLEISQQLPHVLVIIETNHRILLSILFLFQVVQLVQSQLESIV